MHDDAPQATIQPAAYRIDGAGEPVVLVHGVGMNKAVWAPQVDHLSTTHRVIAYDMLGHGGSPLPGHDAGLGDYVRQLHGLLDALSIDAANLIGHSMGALVVLAFALSHPARALRVAALNAVYERTAEQRAAVVARADALQESAPAGTAAQTIARWFGEEPTGAQAETAARVRRWLETVDPIGYARTYRVFATSDDAFVGRLGELAIPALFMTGERDPNSTPEMSRRMADAAPFGRAEILRGERHMMALTAPETVNRRLSAFLAEPRARPPSGR